MGWTLSVDFGTTNTAAAYALDRQAPRPVRLSSAADTIPSAVLVGKGGTLVGVEAIRSRRLRPESYLESPKLAIGQDAVLLGDDEVPVTALVASVLGHVARISARFAGSEVPTRVVLTHPHDWAAHRRAALRAAWEATGIPTEDVRLVPEPIAAATWLATETELPQGATIGVFDYGGGTCDVAVLRRTSAAEQSWQVLGHGGRADLGGAAIDLILLRWVRETLRRLGHAEVLTALDEDLAALRTLQDEVRLAKEALSEWPDASISVAVGPHSLSLSITAAEFDTLVEAEATKARDLTERVLGEARIGADDLWALYLTGGSSHLRAVHATLADLLSGRPARLGDPKLVVALGAHAAPGSGEPDISVPPQAQTLPVALAARAPTPGLLDGQLYRPTLWVDRTAVTKAFQSDEHRRRVPMYPEYEIEAAVSWAASDAWVARVARYSIGAGIRIEPTAAISHAAVFVDADIDDFRVLDKQVPVIGTDGYSVVAVDATGTRVILAAASTFGAADMRCYTAMVAGKSSDEDVLTDALRQTISRPPEQPDDDWIGNGAAVFGPVSGHAEQLIMHVNDRNEGGERRATLLITRDPALQDTAPEAAAVSMLDIVLTQQSRRELSLPYGRLAAIAGIDQAGAARAAVISAATNHNGRPLVVQVHVSLKSRMFGGNTDPWTMCVPLLRAVRVAG